MQVIYCRDHLGIDPEKLNVNGGSISIGHPFGMTGSRMVGTIANEMARRESKAGRGDHVYRRRARRGGIVRAGELGLITPDVCGNAPALADARGYRDEVTTRA